MTPITKENTSLRIRDGNQGETTMRKNLARKTYASAIVALATVLVFTSCGRRQSVYTDVSPPKLQRACQAVDEATGLEMTETDRAWCRSMMQVWYSDTSYTRPDPADQFAAWPRTAQRPRRGRRDLCWGRRRGTARTADAEKGTGSHRR